MVNPTDVTTHDGKPVDWLTHYALCLMEIDLGYSLTVVQGHHLGTAASAGTHDRWGVVDLAPWHWQEKIRAGDKVGFVLQHRLKNQGPWNEHVHGNLVADFDRMAPVAQRQVTSYRAGRDGLKSNRVDSTKRTRPFVELKWPGSAQALAVEKRAAALRAPKVPVKTDTGLRVDGIDLSHHNTVTQAGLTAAAKAGVDYVYLKSTEGTTVKDATYPARRAMVRRADMLVGPYHFAGPDTKVGDAAAEARFFLAYAKPAAGDMRPVLDLEKMGGLNRKQLTAWVGEFVQTVKASIGVLPVVYTPFDLDDNFGCMLWVARYSDSNAAPHVPAPWTKWRMRQFSDGKFGKPNSIAGMRVDLNTLHDGEDLDYLRIPVGTIKPPATPAPAPVTPTPKPTPAKPVEPAPDTVTTTVANVQVNVQGTDPSQVAIGTIHDAAAQGDVIGWNELSTAVLQNAVKALPGFDTYAPNGLSGSAVAISWSSAKYEMLASGSIRTNLGVKGITPARYINWVQLRDLKTWETFYRINTHVVHHIEVGGKARVRGALLGQNARARAHFAKLADLTASLAKKGPVVGGGDLNVDLFAEKHLPPTQRTKWFPYTVLGRVASVAVPPSGTHGGRAIDWLWTKGCKVTSDKVLPRGASDHNPRRTVVTF